MRDEVLADISKELGSEYMTVSEYLDIGPTRMAELEQTYQDNEQERFVSFITMIWYSLKCQKNKETIHI